MSLHGDNALSIIFRASDDNVYCLMKDRGCEWTGVLRDLDAHLDVDTGDCQFVDVQCPNKCSQPVQKREVPDHLDNFCPKRDYNCRYCGFAGSYEMVCNEHYPQCDSYTPSPAPTAAQLCPSNEALWTCT